MKKSIILLLLVIFIPLSMFLSNDLSFGDHKTIANTQDGLSSFELPREDNNFEYSSLILRKNDFLKIENEIKELNVNVTPLSSLEIFIVKGDKKTIETLGKYPDLDFTSYFFKIVKINFF